MAIASSLAHSIGYGLAGLLASLGTCTGGGDAPDAGTPDAAPAGWTIVPGQRVGPVAIGASWAELQHALGAPPAPPIVRGWIAYASWPQLGVEAVLTSPTETAIADDAEVIGAAATATAAITGELHAGLPRAGVEALLGVAPESFGGRAFYPAGVVVEYGAGDVSSRIAVVDTYALAPEPPPMTPSTSHRPKLSVQPAPDGTGVIIDGRTIPVIDMHLHPGTFGTMSSTSKPFLSQGLPPFLSMYAPALFDRIGDAYAPNIGIHAQTTAAGVSHAVLFAVYTPMTTGYFTNEHLEEVLADPRNAAPGGGPWAWGLASIDFDAWRGDVSGARYRALRSYLVRRPDLFIGIKLAHAHQGIRFDDPDFQGVYQIAAETGAPVLLHTGLSPFPGTQDDPAYYDPQNLETVITSFDGHHGLGRVDFVLAHVGQGDARAVAHALDLAADHDNVWLELSALARPLLIDENGAPVTSTEPQYPAVLAALRERGLIGRALFASDGPQFPGAIRTYLGRIVQGMIDDGYSADEIAQVLSGNFRRLFLHEPAR